MGSGFRAQGSNLDRPGSPAKKTPKRALVPNWPANVDFEHFRAIGLASQGVDIF
jgi:hypothetical protein